MSLHNHRLSFLAGAALALTLGTAQAQNSANPSPTVAQTVKPPPDTATPDKASGMSNMADKQTMKRQHQADKKRMKSTQGSSPTTDTSAVGGGSGGTTPGRVGNTTNSNAKGEPGKTP